jgi:hypothetical protein
MSILLEWCCSMFDFTVFVTGFTAGVLYYAAVLWWLKRKREKKEES